MPTHCCGRCRLALPLLRPVLLLMLALLTGISAWLVPQPQATAAVASQQQPDIAALYGKLPLSFIAQGSQIYEAHSRGGLLTFTPDEVVLTLPLASAKQALKADAPVAVAIQLRFEGAEPELANGERLPGVANYFVGNDPGTWRRNLPTYAGVLYRHLYPGIDLAYDGNESLLKGTYTVAPGSDPTQISWHYAGASGTSIDAGGNLIVELPGGIRLTEKAPVAWQEINGVRVPVAVRYTVTADGSTGFAVGAYDRSVSLTIDPTIVYSSYIGGSNRDTVDAIAVDASGNVYVAGGAMSTDMPGALYRYGSAGHYDGFVTKINATGNAAYFTTYFGGSVSPGGNNPSDEASGIALDGSGNIYIAGTTYSTDFPSYSAVQPSCYVSQYGTCTDAFALKLSSTGNSLYYSTYLGGSGQDFGSGIAVDSAGRAYVVGSTPTGEMFSSPVRGYGGGTDAFVACLSTAGNSYVYKTFLGGSATDTANSIALDSSNNAYIVGSTSSTNFPTANARQFSNAGGTDAYVTKLNSSGSIVNSTYLGGSDRDVAYGVAVDGSGNAYITGETQSTNFPTVNAYRPSLGGGSDAFIAKLSAAGNILIYSSYLGGSGSDEGDAIVVDSSGNAYVTGDTASSNFPVLSSIQSYAGSDDVFVTKFNPSGTSIGFSTLIGGSGSDAGFAIALDGSGNIYLGGHTTSTDYPTQGAIKTTLNGSNDTLDGFVTKLSQNGPGAKTWTFMIYMDADNNLSAAMASAKTRLEKLAANPNVNIVMAYDGPGTGDSYYYLIQPGGSYSDNVNRFPKGELNMGNPTTLSDFITWAHTTYPAQYYALAIVDHGRGAQGIAWDDTSSGDYLKPDELRTAYSTATSSGSWKIDTLIYDACLMGMLEEAYQARDYARYLVAQENIGWGVFIYDQYVKSITATTTPDQLAKSAALLYHNSLGTDLPHTVAAIDLSKIVTVANAASSLGVALDSVLSTYKGIIQTTRDSTQKYDSVDYGKLTTTDEYLDLYDFARRIKNNISNSTVQTAAQGVMDAMNGGVIMSEYHASATYPSESYIDLSGSHGLSIFFPPRSGSSDYSKYTGNVSFVFTADLQWDDFLNDYFGAMGLPPSTDPDPTLPPYPVPLSNSVYVPVTLRANVAGW